MVQPNCSPVSMSLIASSITRDKIWCWKLGSTLGVNATSQSCQVFVLLWFSSLTWTTAAGGCDLVRIHPHGFPKKNRICSSWGFQPRHWNLGSRRQLLFGETGGEDQPGKECDGLQSTSMDGTRKETFGPSHDRINMERRVFKGSFSLYVNLYILYIRKLNLWPHIHTASTVQRVSGSLSILTGLQISGVKRFLVLTRINL